MLSEDRQAIHLARQIAKETIANIAMPVSATMIARALERIAGRFEQSLDRELKMERAIHDLVKQLEGIAGGT